MTKAQYRHHGCRITDDLQYKSMNTIFMENELIRVGVLLDKGCDIFQLVYKPTDTDFLWISPQGLINPHRFTETIASSAGNFLDTYHGGWQEILPGGGPAKYQGAELGLHGEVTHLSWDYNILEDTVDTIAIKFQVDCVRTPFRLERVMRLRQGVAALFLEETLTNLSCQKMEFMWGHHPAIGAPFLKEGLKILVPAAKGEVQSPRFAASGILEPGAEFSWPFAKAGNEELDLSRVYGPEAGFAELIYLKELTAGWYAVIDTSQKLGIGFSWPLDIFPYLWFWLVYGQAPGYPWWSRIYCLALEPWTSIPNSLTEVLSAGNQAVLKGGDSITVPFNAVVITGRDSISDISLDGTVC